MTEAEYNQRLMERVREQLKQPEQIVDVMPLGFWPNATGYGFTMTTGLIEVRTRTGLCEARNLDGELCGYKARASSLPYCGVHWKGKE